MYSYGTTLHVAGDNCVRTVTVDKELYVRATGRSLKQGTWSTITLTCVLDVK